VTRANPLSTFVPAEVAVAPWASVRPTKVLAICWGVWITGDTNG
jgi:hypothetical protein